MRWETWREKFLLKLEASCSPETIRHYRNRLRLFEKFWEEEYHSPLPEPKTLRKADFLKFLSWMKERGYHQNYQSRIYGDVVRFLEFCSNPNIKAILSYKPKRSWKQLSYIPTNEVVKRILSVHWKTEVVDVRNRLIIGLLFFTGMKPHEIANLNVDSIETTEGVYDLLLVKSSKRRWRRVPIPKSCISSKIEDYIANYRLNTDEKALFTTRNGRITPARISSIAKEAGSMVGISYFTSRAARRWFVKSLHMNDVSPFIIRRLMGLSDLQRDRDVIFHPTVDIIEDRKKVSKVINKVCQGNEK